MKQELSTYTSNALRYREMALDYPYFDQYLDLIATMQSKADLDLIVCGTGCFPDWHILHDVECRPRSTMPLDPKRYQIAEAMLFWLDYQTSQICDAVTRHNSLNLRKNIGRGVILRDDVKSQFKRLFGAHMDMQEITTAYEQLCAPMQIASVQCGVLFSDDESPTFWRLFPFCLVQFT